MSQRLINLGLRLEASCPNLKFVKTRPRSPWHVGPCGTLPLALKPNAVPRINWLLSNFYFCANWSVVPCQMIGLEGPVWGGGYMPRRRRLYANCQLPVELILYELRPNSPGGGYMPTTIRRRLYANWYSTNSDLTVPAEVICHFPLQLAYELRPKWSNNHGGGYMPRTRTKVPFLGRTLYRGPTKIIFKLYSMWRKWGY